MLDFPNFLRMLTGQPWSSMLPEGVTSELPFLINQHCATARRVRSMTEPENLTGNKVLTIMRELFTKVDTDASGALDVDELKVLLQHFCEWLDGTANAKKPISADDSMAAEVINEFGDGFTVSFR